MLRGYQDCRYEEDHDFTGFETDIKPIAFYLPQFHPIPENDLWWGKGFTEWTNARKALPRYPGHYMPRVPHKSIGYYDLSDYRVIEVQAALAARHGIYGFCFYTYWFSGKRLLEKPVDLLLQHPEVPIHYCLCWANENWTKRWDGQESNVLMRQDYREEDPEHFILDMKQYLEDPRYIRIDGKPLLMVYAPRSIPDPATVFRRWRETAVRSGIGEIYIAICRTFRETAKSLGILDAVDAEVEFPPHVDSIEPCAEIIKTSGDDSFIRSYSTVMHEWRYDASPKPVFRSVMMAWDNSARRRDGWHSFADFTQRDYVLWIRKAMRDLRKNLPKDKRFLFVNAWNEWCEGTYLEPDEKYGYMSINALSRTIFNLRRT